MISDQSLMKEEKENHCHILAVVVVQAWSRDPSNCRWISTGPLGTLAGRENKWHYQKTRKTYSCFITEIFQSNQFVDKLWSQFFNFEVSYASYKLSYFLFVVRFSNNAQVLFQLVQEIWNSKLFFFAPFTLLELRCRKK
jgi:hypothetical protein